ncbi:flavin monooxygenase-like protein [Powellomyces hirtus]|nr:flavin monooxygenase-like protein [Powellomyces hirtus]
MSLKIAVIGAGVSGLVACKELLATGLEVSVFEKGENVGGIWAYSEDPDTPSVMRQTVLNLSKAQMAFSDFPFPDDCPDYATHQAYEKYLKSYASHFDLLQHIRFSTAVTTVTPLAHGRWKVVSQSSATSATKEEIFDRVVVSAGQNQIPNMPKTPGLDVFKGEVLHSRNYKSFEPFMGKRVLVVGVANSGADVAVDLSGNAEKVLLSGRRGIWLLPRFLLMGKPLDHLMSRKSFGFPSWVTNMFMRFLSRLMVGDMSRFGLGTNINPTSINPTVNDHLGERLATGKVKAHPDIARLHEGEVEFVDGTREKIDAIIYCTGYQRSFPFLPSLAMTGQASPNSPTLSLYKRIVPIAYPGLAFVGHIHGLAHSAVAELQARWVARLFAGDLKLPAETGMQDEIDSHALWVKHNIHGGVSTCEVPPFPYMELLAKDIGCNVDTRALWWNRPVLRKLVLTGTFCPHQYRLFGPGRWEGAEDVIYKTCGETKGKRWTWLARVW